MDSEDVLPDRLQWTLDWQTRNLMPLLRERGAEARLREFWRRTRRMDEVLDCVGLTERALSVDVGGGMTTPLRWLPGRRICVDPLAEHYSARFALPLCRVTYTRGQGETLPFVSDSCDLVVCTNCIDHTDEPRSIVAEIARVLKPGGWFWFTCEENPPDQPRNAGHPHALDKAAIRDFVDGFAIELAWEEPWRGIYGHLLDREPLPTMELGFLVRKPVSADESA